MSKKSMASAVFLAGSLVFSAAGAIAQPSEPEPEETGTPVPISEHDQKRELESQWLDSSPVGFGQARTIRVYMNSNYAPGQFDDPEVPQERSLRIELENGKFSAVPASLASGEISEDGKVLTGTFVQDQSTGAADHIDVPVLSWGPNGSEIKASITDDGENQTDPGPVPIKTAPAWDVGMGRPIYYSQPRMLADREVLQTFPTTVTTPGTGEPASGPMKIVYQMKDDINVKEITAVSVAGNKEAKATFSGKTITVEVPAKVSMDSGARRTAASFALNVTVRSTPNATKTVSYTLEIVDAEGQTLFGNPLGMPDEDARNHVGKVAIWAAGTMSSHFTSKTIESDPRTYDAKQDKVNLGHAVGTTQIWAADAPAIPGDQAESQIASSLFASSKKGDFDKGGYCLVFDASAPSNGMFDFIGLNPKDLEYLEGKPGSIADPAGICGAGSGWTKTKPANSQFKAVRLMFTPDSLVDTAHKRTVLMAGTLLNDQGDGFAWQAGAVYYDPAGAEKGKWHTSTSDIYTATPGARYAGTTSFRDAFRLRSHRSQVALTASPTHPEPGENVTYTVQGTVVPGTQSKPSQDVTYTVTMPTGFTYVEGSAKGASEPEAQGADLIFKAKQNASAEPSFSFALKPASVVGSFTTNVVMVNNSAPASDGDYRRSEDSAMIETSASGATLLGKDATMREFAWTGSNGWDLTVRNVSATAQKVVDTIDVLPYLGDDRGTSFTGQILLKGITAPEGTDIFVTTHDAATLTDDPNSEGNGGLGEPSEIWEPMGDDLTGVTAIRFVSHDVPAGAQLGYNIAYRGEDITNGDKLVNSASSRATETRLVMVNSAASTVVQDPARIQVDKRLDEGQLPLLPGKELVYTLTVRGTGPGVVRDAQVRDVPVKNLESAVIYAPSQGTIAKDGVWKIGQLAEGQVVTAKVKAGIVKEFDPASGDSKVINRVWGEDGIPPTDPPEECIPNEKVEDDTDGCDEVETGEDSILKVFKSNPFKADQRVSADETIEFDVVVKNSGSDPASNVRVDEIPGKGLKNATFDSATASMGSVDKDGVWQVGTLAPGEQATISVKATANQDAEEGIVNQVRTSSPFHPDTPTCVPNDDVDTDDDQCDEVSHKNPPLPPEKPLPLTGAKLAGLGLLAVLMAATGGSMVYLTRRRHQ